MDGGREKAQAAAESLKKIFPGVVSVYSGCNIRIEKIEKWEVYYNGLNILCL